MKINKADFIFYCLNERGNNPTAFGEDHKYLVAKSRTENKWGLFSLVTGELIKFAGCNDYFSEWEKVHEYFINTNKWIEVTVQISFTVKGQ